jgi:hypothetical protein
MPRPVPTTVTEQTLYDQDYLAFMASLLISDPHRRHRFQSGMALLATWFAMTGKQGGEDHDTLLTHIKLQWWADTLAGGHHADHPLLQEAPRDLITHPVLPLIIASFRAVLDMKPSTPQDWTDYLQQTFGAMGAVIYGDSVPSFSLWGWQKHMMRGDALPNLWRGGPEKGQEDTGIMARAVRALGPRPKNPKSPWVVMKLWAGV